MSKITLLQGNALAVLKTLPSKSVNCVVTSPPYWSLRDYKTEPQVWDWRDDCQHEFNEQNFCLKCGAWRGSLGLEPYFELYIKHLCDIFDEVQRVLRKDGTCWVNLGDTYAGSMCGYGATKDSKTGFQKAPINAGFYGSSIQKPPSANAIYHENLRYEPRGKTKEVPAKSLCLIPFRFAIEMVNRGWILRNTIIWHKRNCIPSSVKDRFTVDFEYVFFFVKSRKYWFEQQFEKYQLSSIKRAKYNVFSKKTDKGIHGGMTLENQRKTFNKILTIGQGRNMRCVWDISTKPFKGAHFAVFCEDLVKPMILAGCPEFVCRKCKLPRKKIIEREGLSSADYMRGKEKSHYQSE